jgi:hypothetical protein
MARAWPGHRRGFERWGRIRDPHGNQPRYAMARAAIPREGSGAMNSICALPVPYLVTRKEPGPVAPDGTMAYRSAQRPATEWPLLSYLEYAALPTAPGSARKHAWAIALEFGLSDLADTIERSYSA